MKNVLILLLIGLGIVCLGLNAAEPTSFSTTGAVPQSFLWADLTIAKDTLVSVDSSTIVSTRSFPQEWNYVLVSPGPWAGTGNDSVSLKVRVDMFAKDTSTIPSYSYSVDTLSATGAPEAIALPINNSLFGYKARVKLIGIAATGTQVITPTKYFIYAVRPVLIEKKY
jgi:hypothetical protein